MKITSDIETVTPEMAMEWLTAETNLNNRKLKPPVVRKYVRDMSDRNWLFNGDTIKFDWNGKLLDGQHRLHALIATNRTTEFNIVRNLDPDAYKSIDIGARRTTGDIMQHAGSKYGTSAAAAAKVLHWYESGQKDFTAMQSISELVAVYGRHPDLEGHVARYNNTPAVRKKLRVGAAWPAFTYLVGATFSAELEEFVAGISDGTSLNGLGIGKGDPRHTAREWFLNRVYRRASTNDERFCIITKAWNAFIGGRSMQSISYRFNEAPPVLIVSRPR